MNAEPELDSSHDDSRRTFLKQSSVLTAMAIVPSPVITAAAAELD